MQSMQSLLYMPYIVCAICLTALPYLQGYSNYGTYFKFEGSQNTVTFGPTTTAVAQDCTTASISIVTFTGHNLSEKVR